METYEEKIYTITLTDGTVITDLKMNGNNYISTVPVSADIFVDNCDPVVISDGENEETHEHMALIYGVRQRGEEYWFALRDRTTDELARLKMQSDIEYVAMMADIEL